MNQSSLNSSNNQNGSFEIPLYNPYVIKDVPLKIAQTVIGTILNAFALIVLVTMKKKTFSHCLFISLSASDLMNSSLFSGLSIFGLGYLSWPLGDFLCFVYQFFCNAQYAVSNLTVLIISINRFVLLNRVVKNGETLSKLKVSFLLLSWLFPYIYVPIMIVVLMNNGLFDYSSCVINYPFLFLIVHNSLVNLLPGFLSMSTNILSVLCLVRKWRRRVKLVAPRQTRMNQSASSIERNVNIDSLVSVSFGLDDAPKTVAQGEERARTKEVRYRKKLSNEFKAVICILLVVLNIAINEYPCLIVWMLLVKCYECTNLEFFYGTLRMVFFFPILNPIILLLFNQSFKSQVIRILNFK